MLIMLSPFSDCPKVPSVINIINIINISPAGIKFFEYKDLTLLTLLTFPLPEAFLLPTGELLIMLIMYPSPQAPPPHPAPPLLSTPSFPQKKKKNPLTPTPLDPQPPLKVPLSQKKGELLESGALPKHLFSYKVHFFPQREANFREKKIRHNDGFLFGSGKKSSYFPSFKHFLEKPYEKKWSRKGPRYVLPHENGLIFPERGVSRHETIRKIVFFAVFFGLPVKPTCMSLYPIAGILAARISPSLFFVLASGADEATQTWRQARARGWWIGGGGCCRIPALGRREGAVSPRRARLTTPMSVVAPHVEIKIRHNDGLRFHTKL